MTEDEWLVRDDPVGMLAYLTWTVPSSGTTGHIGPRKHPLISQRKTRLFACAVARLAWDSLKDENWRQAIQAGETFADGQINSNDLAKAWYAAFKASQPARSGYSRQSRLAVACAARPLDLLEELHRILYTREEADLLREVVGNPSQPLHLPYRLVAWEGEPEEWSEEDVPRLKAEGKAVCPWLTDTVISLAHAAYSERQDSGALDAATLSILADALLDAGCSRVDIQTHLRQQERGPCVRGCHVVDCLLGKE